MDTIMSESQEEQEALERHKRNREAIIKRHESQRVKGRLDCPEQEQELHKETKRFLKELNQIRNTGN